ncbi:MAG: hypothetical protein CVU46_04405 [Chloroflexi bacterium HGW-Chloroflexi-8]|jgi:hypothetical protein|nr:MAG: hypothetical protein CVU46_04405 [Chloroflexi bacterium HGW-Chloroflexi-8]
MKFTLDTTLGTLLDDPQAKKILEQYVPGLAANPMIAMAKGMTLTMLLAMPQAAQLGLTKEKVQSVLDEINKKVQ